MDWLSLAYEKSSSTLRVTTDPLGHVPCFYSTTPSKVRVSRSLRALVEGESLPPDPLGVAQFLTFSTPLGSRTLYDGIRRLEGGCVLEIGSTVKVRRYAELPRPIEGLSSKEHAEELVPLFLRACRELAGKTNLLSLSGGLDSKAVFLALRKLKIAFRAVSFVDEQGDYEAARAFASSQDVPWSGFRADSGAGERRRLAQLCAGQQSVGLAFVLPFLRQLARRYGRGAVLFTGDSGYALRDAGAAFEFPPRRGLIEPLFNDAGQFRLNPIHSWRDACRIAGADPDEFIDELSSQLNRYDGSFERKRETFVLREYIMKWVYDGIERNRSHLRCAAPHEATPFFLRAMACPTALKKSHALYFDFLQRLAPDFQVDRWRYEHRRALRELLWKSGARATSSAKLGARARHDHVETLRLAGLLKRKARSNRNSAAGRAFRP